MNGARRKLERKIKEKEAEIQALGESLRAARSYLMGLRDALKFIPNDGDTDESETSPEVSIRPGSATESAYKVLKETGKPMQIMDLLQKMGREPTPEARASVGSVLAAYVRSGKVFTRPAPNTYGLAEWQSEKAEVEPPEDFGLSAAAETELNGLG